MNIGEIISLGEPQLQFSTGRHNTATDPRQGLASYHPLDYVTGKRDFLSIDIGVIAEDNDIRRVLTLLNGLNSEFRPVSRGSKVEYTGFENIYKSSLNIPEAGDSRVITFSSSDTNGTFEKRYSFDNIIELYNQRIQQYRDSNRGRSVLVLQLPKKFEEYFKVDHKDLKAHIKTLCIRKDIYVQILTQNCLEAHDRCDNMWNLSLGVYVKAGGTPWKLGIGEEGTCFIGIAFGIKKNPIGQDVLVGLAEVFDLFGESVTIKVVEDSYNREIGLHLSAEKSEKLIKTAIKGYEDEKHNKPQEVIIHKTTYFNSDEKMGIKNALGDISYNLVYLKLNTSLKLIPDHGYPPLRGTFWKMNDRMGVLYTAGYIEEFKTYPGAATPSPVEIDRNKGNIDVEKLAKQILGLTKMDWNTTVLMKKEPVTIKLARKVCDMLKAGLKPEEILKDFRHYSD